MKLYQKILATFALSVALPVGFGACQTNSNSNRAGRAFTGTLGNQKIDLTTRPENPKELVQDLLQQDGPVLILLGDTAHTSIGVQTVTADILQDNLLLTNIFLEQSDSNQKRFDQFASAIMRNDLGNPAIQEFKNQISQAEDDYWAPDDAALRIKYFSEKHRVFETVAKHPGKTSFIDSSVETDEIYEDLRFRAAKIRNKKIDVISSLDILQRISENPELDFQKVIDPIRQDIDNISNFTVAGTRQLTEQDRSKLFNIAKAKLDRYFEEFNRYPDSWRKGDADLKDSFDWRSITKLCGDMLDSYKGDEADKKRDDYRNNYMLQGIQKAVSTPGFDRRKFKGFFKVGQGHFEADRDLDEMLRTAFPDFKIVRIDVVPASDFTLSRLHLQTAEGNHQGSDFVVFVPCETAKYKLDLQEVKAPGLLDSVREYVR